MELENKMMPPLYLLNLLVRDFFQLRFHSTKGSSSFASSQKTAHVFCGDRKEKTCFPEFSQDFLRYQWFKNLHPLFFMSTYLSTTSPLAKVSTLRTPKKNKNDPMAAKCFYVEKFTSQQIFTVVFHLFVETERKRQQKEILQKKNR